MKKAFCYLFGLLLLSSCGSKDFRLSDLEGLEETEAQQTIQYGTGFYVSTEFPKINANFTELFGKVVSNVGLSGTTLTITFSDATSVTGDLSGLQDGIGTDDQTITDLSLLGTTLSVTLEGGNTATLNLGTVFQSDLDVPSQAEAEAGTSTTERAWTALRIAQAISALAPGGVDEVVYEPSCTGITNGFCIDTSNGKLYYYNNTTSTEVVGSGGAVDSVNGQTGAIVLNPDDLSDTSTTNKFITQVLLNKLAAIEENATADQTGAEIKALYEALTDTNAFTDSLLSKLNGIASGATVNSPDATLLSRSNHTGTQPLSTVSGAGSAAGKDTGVNIGNVVELGNDGTGNPALPFALFDPSGFSGNLAATDDTFNKVFDKLDGLSTGGGATPTIQSADPTSTSSVGWYMATTSGDAFYKSAAGLFNVSAGTYTADPVNYTLTIDSTGWGAGDTVTGTGINCPGDCTEDYLDGTNVSLTAAAGTGRQFDGWTGALTGTTNPDSVAMTANRSVGANFSATGGGVTTFEDFEGTGTPTGWTVTHGIPDFDYTTTVLSGIESLYYNSAGNPMRFETSSLGVSGEVYIGFMVNMTAQGTSFEIRLRDSTDNVLAVIDKGTVSDSLVVQVTGGTAYQTPTDSWQLSTTTYIKIRYKPSNGVDNAEIQGWTSTDGTTWTSTSATSTNATSPIANVDHLYFTCNFETITAVFDDIRYSSTDFNF